ncbi:SGNH/GDSL hydrolase family protein [Desulfonatronum thioautotrophicum]|uniref:SGNH/GDSL hydrolase family protein n=1 Tax=Desulfonatronum thioautotrophicum TaxID=617001 RepID=UPI000699695D|nr:GDSL-type esterase/lipase family protein [Desulfonatronum thioautotrophicum]
MYMLPRIAQKRRCWMFAAQCAGLFALWLIFFPLVAQGALPGREPAAISPSQDFDFGENNPDVYLCMGDSITFGAGVASEESYPAVLQQLLGKTVINDGVSGSRSTLGVTRVNGLLQRYKPGYLLILYGVNDIGERDNADILENLRFMVRAAKENQTIPVVATLTPVFGPRGWKTRGVMDLNQRIRVMATEEGILLVDLEEAFAWDASLISDNGIHPNKDGYFLLAKTFFDTLKEDPGSSGGGGCVVGGGKGSYDLLVLLGFLGLYAAWNVSKRSRCPTRLDQHQNHYQRYS